MENRLCSAVAVPRFSPLGERQQSLTTWRSVEISSPEAWGRLSSKWRQGNEGVAMEGLTRLVTESLARHGFETPLDYSRLRWSKWSRFESSLSVILAPSKPGIFALGEELLAPGEAEGGRRLLALFRISETEDIGAALGRFFLPGNPEREHLAAGRCFVRYSVIEDPAQRQAACAALQEWMQSSAALDSAA